MSTVRKIFSNTAWQVFGKVITAVLGIISIKYVTNYLDRSMYGEYTTIYDFTATFAIIGDFGLFTIAVREMAHAAEKKAVEKIVGNVLSIRIVLAVLALGLGIFVASLVPSYQESHIPLGVLIVSLATIVTLVAGTMSSVLQFYLKMQWASAALIVGKIITVAYIVFTIIWLFPKDSNAGFPHLQTAWILGGVFTLLITYIACNKVIPISMQFDFVFWKNVLIKALPYGLALVLGTIYFRMGTITLSLLRDHDASGYFKEQVGLYGVPLRVLEILQIIPHYFMNSVLPILTLRIKMGADRASNIIRYCLNSLWALALPTLVGGYILAWPITAAVSSPEFLTRVDAFGNVIYGSDLALKILLFAMTLTYLHVALSYSLVAMGRQIDLLWINLVAVTVNITFNWILAPRYGFVGSAVTAVITESIMLIVLFIRTRMHGIRKIWDISFISKTIFSTLCMGIVLWFSYDFFTNLLFSKALFLLVPLGGIVYAGCMVLTRAVSKDMVSLVRKIEPPTEE